MGMKADSGSALQRNIPPSSENAGASCTDSTGQRLSPTARFSWAAMEAHLHFIQLDIASGAPLAGQSSTRAASDLRIERNVLRFRWGYLGKLDVTVSVRGHYGDNGIKSDFTEGICMLLRADIKCALLKHREHEGATDTPQLHPRFDVLPGRAPSFDVQAWPGPSCALFKYFRTTFRENRKFIFAGACVGAQQSPEFERLAFRDHLWRSAPRSLLHTTKGGACNARCISLPGPHTEQLQCPF